MRRLSFSQPRPSGFPVIYAIRVANMAIIAEGKCGWHWAEKDDGSAKT
jgi:hypothetical protein